MAQEVAEKRAAEISEKEEAMRQLKNELESIRMEAQEKDAAYSALIMQQSQMNKMNQTHVQENDYDETVESEENTEYGKLLLNEFFS